VVHNLVLKKKRECERGEEEGATIVKIKTFVGQRLTEVRSKPTEISFFCRFWTNFRQSLADESFAMQVS
jgi:hypothetical protein